MPYLVRFHGPNPTVRARADLPIDDVQQFFALCENRPREFFGGEIPVSGVSLWSVCEECGHQDQVANVRTEVLG